MSAIKDRCEGVASNPAAAFLLRAAFPCLCRLLATVPAELEEPLSHPHNRLRGMAVEQLGRLPVPELPKPFVPELLAACHQVLAHDHEDSGLVAQRVLFEVHKTYKSVLEELSGPFFEWLRLLYENLPGAYDRLIASHLPAPDAALGTGRMSLGVPVQGPKEEEEKDEEADARVPSPGRPPTSGVAAASPAPPSSSPAPPLTPARASFKLAADVALTVVFLFQCYPKRLHQYAGVLPPLMVEALTPTPEAAAVPASAQAAFADCCMAQIKILSFLTVMARTGNLAPALSQHRAAVCGALLRLMRCVPDQVPVRRELLIALRNLLPTPFKVGLLPHMDEFLDEPFLVGRSPTCVEALRPLACSTVAELVASSKAELRLEQLRRVVRLYASLACDCSQAASLQGTSLRLLYNLVETLFQRR
ncbi:hypothetical protein H632_c541p1, partial [Helicosporidium sp. ATCC 50920]